METLTWLVPAALAFSTFAGVLYSGARARGFYQLDTPTTAVVWSVVIFFLSRTAVFLLGLLW